MKKRIFAILLALVLIVQVCPVPLAQAEGEVCTCGTTTDAHDETCPLSTNSAAVDPTAFSGEPGCTCGNAADESGVVTHADTCALYQAPAPAPTCICAAGHTDECPVCQADSAACVYIETCAHGIPVDETCGECAAAANQCEHGNAKDTCEVCHPTCICAEGHTDECPVCQADSTKCEYVEKCQHGTPVSTTCEQCEAEKKAAEEKEAADKAAKEKEAEEKAAREAEEKANYATLAELIAALPSADDAKAMTQEQGQAAYAQLLNVSDFITNKGLTLTAEQEAFLGALNLALNEAVYAEGDDEGGGDDDNGNDQTTAVAKIGETTYTTLSEAFSKAVPGDTITLLTNAELITLGDKDISDLTITAAENVTVNGIFIDTKQITTGLKINNLTITNINFVNKGLYFNCEGGNGTPWATVTNLKMEGCTFTTTSQEDVLGNRLFDVGADSIGSNQFRNITITGCTATGGIQGIRLGNLYGATISNNAISGVAHNAITLRAVQSGNVTVSGNTISGGGDRAFRIATVAAGATVAFNNNTITNTGDSDDSNYKVNTNSGTVTFSGNTVDGNSWMEPVASVGGKEYADLSSAVNAAASENKPLELPKAASDTAIITEAVTAVAGNERSTVGLTIPVTVAQGSEATVKMDNAVVKTVAKNNQAVVLNVEQEAKKTDNSKATYEITLTVGTDAIHELGGTLTITLPLPSGLLNSQDVKVYHVKDDGTKEAMPTEVSGSNVIFTTTHLSEFEIAEGAFEPELIGTFTPGIIKNTDTPNDVWRIIGEVRFKAKTSFVLKLYAGENLIATSTLSGSSATSLLTGEEKETTWAVMVKGTSSSWNTTWEGNNPIANMVPTKVELILDGVSMGKTEVKMTDSNDYMGDSAVLYNWGDIPGVMIAQVGSTYYGTLQETINAASAGQTVTLLGNTKIDNISDGNANTMLHVDADDNVVIDLNGNTVDGSFFITSGGTATIKNGTISNNRTVSGVETQGTLTLDNMTITSDRHAVRVSGGTTTINSGTYSTTATSGTHHAVNISDNSNVTINGGTITGYGPSNNGNTAVATRGSGTTLTITGGEFSNPGGNFTIGAWGGTLSITGGIFHKSSTDTLNMGGVNAPSGSGNGELKGIEGGIFEDKPDVQLLATGKAAAQITSGTNNGWYEIVDAKAKIENVGNYATLQEAIAAATSGNTVTLLTDIELSENVTLDATAAKTITLNLGDHNLTGSPIMFTNLNSQLTVVGGKLNENQVVFQGNPDNGYSINQKTTTVENGVTYSYEKEADTYTITYNNVDGATNPNTATTYTIETDTITLQNATKTGYTFGGWFADSDFSSVVTEITKGSTEDKTLYAKWTPVEYTITFNYGGGALPAGKTNPATYTIETETFTLVEPVREGYLFNYWMEKTGDSSAVSKTSVTIQKGSYGNLSYEVVWAEAATVTFDSKGGSTVSPVTVMKGAKLTEPVNPTKSGYRFDGWYTDTSCSTSWDFTNGVVTANMTLYAKWTKKSDQATLTISDPGTKTYGDTAFTLTTSGGSGNGAVTFTSSDNSILSFSGNKATIHKAGTVTVTATKAGDDTYNDATATYTLTIGKKKLTVTYQGETITTGQTPRQLLKYEGFVTGDTSASLTKAPAVKFGTIAIGAKTYKPEGGESGNYEFTYKEGTLTVNPAIIKGAEQTVTAGNDAAFTSDADYKYFVRVELDGYTLQDKYYDSRSGSTIVTLHADFVKTLAAGTHTLSIVSEINDAEYKATTSFTVKKLSSGGSGNGSYVIYDSDSPKTGDTTHTGLYLVLALVGAFGVFALLLTKKYLIKRK